MRISRILLLVVATASLAPAADGSLPGVRWVHVGGGALNSGLAGPVGGPLSQVAFSRDGATLFARTSAGRVWQSSDLGDTWQPSTPEEVGFSGLFDLPAEAPAVGPPRQEPQARVVSHPYRRQTFYALGRDLYRSPDDGRSWINLTSDGLASIIGPWQSSIAFHPTEPDILAISNSAGIWKSADGGLSWSSLNDRLPNFPRTRLISAAPDLSVRLLAASWGAFENTPGAGDLWLPAANGAGPSWQQLLESLPAGDRHRASPTPLALPAGVAASYRIWLDGAPSSPDLTLCGSAEGWPQCGDPSRHYISAFAVSGSEQAGASFYYAGTSDGRLWVSDDRGERWRLSDQGLPAAAGAISAIFGDPAEPRVAIAVLAAENEGRVFRTTNGGVFWDDLTADLPPGALYGVEANGETGALYVAGAAGVFYTAGDLRNPSPPTPWRQVTGNLPNAAVHDLLLDTVSGHLYAVLEGFGVYRVRAPAVLDALRVLNAADLSRRPAAPGGLLTLLGGEIRGASVGGKTAPLLAAGAQEAQIQVPFETTGDRLELSLETQLGSTSLGFPLAAVSPAIFLDRGGPLVLDAGSGLLLDAAHPAQAGSQILILATGLGRVRPDWPTGVPAPLEDPPMTIAPVKAYLNGIPLRVLASTLAGGYIGTYMVQAELPRALNFGIAELVLEAAGRRSNAVRIFTEP